MVDQIRVRPKPGTAFPRAAPAGGFVGYALASGEPGPDDYVMPGGPRYRPKDEPETVPNTVYYRRALARGDLAHADEPDESDDNQHDQAPDLVQDADESAG